MGYNYFQAKKCKFLRKFVLLKLNNYSRVANNCMLTGATARSAVPFSLFHLNKFPSWNFNFLHDANWNRAFHLIRRALGTTLRAVIRRCGHKKRLQAHDAAGSIEYLAAHRARKAKIDALLESLLQLHLPSQYRTEAFYFRIKRPGAADSLLDFTQIAPPPLVFLFPTEIRNCETVRNNNRNF